MTPAPMSTNATLSDSHRTNVHPKKKLFVPQIHVDILEDGLMSLVMAGMSEGELQRRTEMVTGWLR